MVGAFQAQHAGGEVHRPRQHAGIDQRRFMVRPVGEGAPGIIFHAARAFPPDPVGVGAAQARILDRLMRVHRDMVAGGGLHHFQMMLRHALAVMPFHPPLSRRIARRDDPAGVGDVAGLDHIDAQAAIKRHRVVQLRLIIGDIAARFMMADQADALLSRIGGQARQVEIRRWLGEAEIVAMAEPFAVPALVPAFDQYAAEAMLRREVDILLRPLGRRPMFGAFRPGPVAPDHAPPDADIFGRREPADVAQLVGLVEVQLQIIFNQARRIVGDAHRAPGRVEGQVARHSRRLRRRRQGRTELASIRALEPIAGIIDQRGFMEAHMRAVIKTHGDRRMRGGHSVDRRLLIDLFITVPLTAGNPPGRAFGCDVELGRLIGDAHRLEPRLFGQLVAEAHTVIEQAEADVHQAIALHIRLAEADQQLVMMVGDETTFAPRLLPFFLAARFVRPDDREAPRHVEPVGQQEAQLRWRDQQLALARKRPGRAAVIVGRYGQQDAAVGRRGGDGGLAVLRHRRRHQCERQGQRAGAQRGGQHDFLLIPRSAARHKRARCQVRRHGRRR